MQTSKLIWVGMLATGCAAQEPDADPVEARDWAPLAESQAEPCAIAVDATGVYWTNRGDGSYGSGAIMKYSHGKSFALATEQDFPSTLALDERGVSWATYRPVDSGNIVRVTHDDGIARALPGRVDVVHGLVTVGERIYWTNAASGMVKSVGTEGGDEVVIAESADGAGPITATAGFLFWGTGSTLVRANLPDGDRQTIVWQGDSIEALAADGSTIAWITQSGAVMTAPLDGSTSETLKAADQNHHAVRGIAIDDAGIYLSDPIAGTVNAISRADGAITTLASQQGEPSSIGVDATHVYWVDMDRGIVGFALKPR